MEATRTVLITGASGGIGRATVQVFAGHGWRVIGVDRKEFGPDFPENGLFIQSSIVHPENLESIYDRAKAFTGTLNALVNNAGIQVAKPMLETTVEEWDEVMAANLRSVFLGARLAHPLLKAAGGGAIVNTSSVHAVATSANIAAYAASKGGLLALTRAMAIEFARQHPRQCHPPRRGGHAHAARRDGPRPCGRHVHRGAAGQSGPQDSQRAHRPARGDRPGHLLPG